MPGLSGPSLTPRGLKSKLPFRKRLKLVTNTDVWSSFLSHDYQVQSGAILQQVFVVEYVVHHHMCEECHRREAQDFWRAVVQVRQKVSVDSIL